MEGVFVWHRPEKAMEEAEVLQAEKVLQPIIERTKHLEIPETVNQWTLQSEVKFG